MTPEQREKWTREADEYAHRRYDPDLRDVCRFEEIRDTEFARLVAQDTWERAARICDADGAYICARAIRAEAAREKA